jgi:hypothetical protein
MQPMRSRFMEWREGASPFFFENKSFVWVALGDLFLLCLIPISGSVVIPTRSYHVAHDRVHWIEFAQKSFNR